MLYPVSPLPPLSSLLKAPGQEPCFLAGGALSWAVFWRKRAGPGPFREHGEGQLPEGEMEGRVRWVGAALQGPQKAGTHPFQGNSDFQNGCKRPHPVGLALRVGVGSWTPVFRPASQATSSLTTVQRPVFQN